MTAAKPDCTGQRFGLLTVVGKGSLTTRGNSRYRRWLLRCDCGNTIELKRGDFDRTSGNSPKRRQSGQRSCGCLGRDRKLKVDNKRRPKDITGQRFGSLVAIELTGRKQQGKPTWLLRCDCGRSREMSLSRLGLGYRLNCGDLSHSPGLHYPPAPNPYPEYAAAIVEKYLYLTIPIAPIFDSRVQDERVNRLIRAAWIIEYRTRWGETFTDLHEYRFICKHLRFAKFHVMEQRRVESGGYSRYTFSRYKNNIGGVMTDLTSQDEAVIETQPEVSLSKSKSRRLKFRRC